MLDHIDVLGPIRGPSQGPREPLQRSPEAGTFQTLETPRLLEASDSQLAIIHHPPSPNELLSVQAGPGSGKTWTLVNRVAYMVEKGGILPEEILILSMTNRAVNSLRDALAGLLGSVLAREIEVCTFHSWCANVVDQYESVYFPQNPKRRLMDDLSWRNFSNIFLGKTIGINGKTLKGNLTAFTLERILNEIKSGESDIATASTKHNVSPEYLDELLQFLTKNGIMRYQDFLINALAIMKKSVADHNLIPRVHNYKMVLVDEFQDMHFLLMSAVKEIVHYPTEGQAQGTLKHLTLAGDKHQCIYEFLGSKPDIDLATEFPKYHITHKTIEETFRLTPEILDASRNVALGSNGLLNQSDVALKSNRDPLYKPITYDPATRFSEYEFVLKETSRLILELGGLFKLSDILVLGRANKDVEEFQSYAEKFGFHCNKFTLTVPWVKGKTHIFLDMLNVIHNGTGSELNWLCLILLLDKKVGSRLRVSKLFNLFNVSKLPQLAPGSSNGGMEAFLREEVENFGVSVSKKQKSLSTIYKMPEHKETVRSLQKLLVSVDKERQFLAHSQTPTRVLESLSRMAVELGLVHHLNLADPVLHGSTTLHQQMAQAAKKLEFDICSFFDSLCHAHENYVSEPGSELFLDHFLHSYNDDVPTTDDTSINVSTVHTAKGLEFPVVFVLGTSASHTSYWRGCVDLHASADPQIARLFYVACTRASQFLYVGCTTNSDRFTGEVPQMARLVPQVAGALARKLPSAGAVDKGTQLFARLYQAPSTANKGPSFGPRANFRRAMSFRSSPLVAVLLRKIGAILSRI
ncbi:P-loop containing nucleoside triphosphate hydrolase protein [Suhomyces tanzawaensis NRRL Y-17324]|uniref:DNA 3'-5' helicase n=1 Tax=Suhomyces tanzawaensis NRRL Y-17324 TaxID=984487 RepID=A0A1E4SJ69_9ASCO|nr:P-loop containing nucleoside triphosphate hydrolase protein [Suhomyces tanzawaensis NRRL Y-17324]ODV79538.1 P-loop containing nucleoside triphosphate hydrolase protein [Suhomyces tanzawaensis NRRL Y-17324]